MINIRDIRQLNAVGADPPGSEAEREHLASLAEVAPDLAFIGRPDGRISWMNHAGKALLGFGRDEDISVYRIENLFSSQEMERIYAEDMPTIARDGDWRGRWTLQARDGTQIPVEVAQHVHHDRHGARVYVSGIMRDLRPQLAKEREQQQTERRLAAAERVAGLGSWEWDTVSNEVKWSPGMYRLHGMAPGDGDECSTPGWPRCIRKTEQGQ